MNPRYMQIGVMAMLIVLNISDVFDDSAPTWERVAHGAILIVAVALLLNGLWRVARPSH